MGLGLSVGGVLAAAFGVGTPPPAAEADNEADKVHEKDSNAPAEVNAVDQAGRGLIMGNVFTSVLSGDRLYALEATVLAARGRNMEATGK